MPQDLEELIQFMELQESAEKSSTAKANKAQNNNGNQNGGNQAGEVPRGLRSTVISVTSTV